MCMRTDNCAHDDHCMLRALLLTHRVQTMLLHKQPLTARMHKLTCMGARADQGQNAWKIRGLQHTHLPSTGVILQCRGRR